MLEVAHLRKHYITDNFKDKLALDITCKEYNIQQPDVIVVKYDKDYYPIAKEMIPEDVRIKIPPTVLNVFIDQAKNPLVSDHVLFSMVHNINRYIYWCSYCFYHLLTAFTTLKRFVEGLVVHSNTQYFKISQSGYFAQKLLNYMKIKCFKYQGVHLVLHVLVHLIIHLFL